MIGGSMIGGCITLADWAKIYMVLFAVICRAGRALFPKSATLSSFTLAASRSLSFTLIQSRNDL